MRRFILKDLKKAASKEKARLLQRFFKTGKGEYGAGDIFLGVMVPEQRMIAKKYWKTDLGDIEQYLRSPIHEKRMIALFILIEKYNHSYEGAREVLYKFYLKNTKGINNWDLVDLSAPKIVGDYLLNHKEERKVLYKLVKSDNLWERRIAILSTFAFIKEKQFEDSLKIANILLNDKHDLIHKAVGWMLREIGKRDVKVLRDFLKENYKIMPRTMLRYTIEKFSKEERERYLKNKI